MARPGWTSSGWRRSSWLLGMPSAAGSCWPWSGPLLVGLLTGLVMATGRARGRVATDRGDPRPRRLRPGRSGARTAAPAVRDRVLRVPAVADRRPGSLVAAPVAGAARDRGVGEHAWELRAGAGHPGLCLAERRGCGATRPRVIRDPGGGHAGDAGQPAPRRRLDLRAQHRRQSGHRRPGERVAAHLAARDVGDPVLSVGRRHSPAGLARQAGPPLAGLGTAGGGGRHGAPGRSGASPGGDRSWHSPWPRRWPRPIAPNGRTRLPVGQWRR